VLDWDSGSAFLGDLLGRGYSADVPWSDSAWTWESGS